MIDDKTKVKEDRKRVAGEEVYEIAGFAKKYGVSPSEATTTSNATDHLEGNWTRIWQVETPRYMTNFERHLWDIHG